MREVVNYADLHRAGTLIIDPRPAAPHFDLARRNQSLLAGLSWWDQVTLIVRGPMAVRKQRRGLE